MTEPLVCCVMLTRDRPAMAARAVAAFRAQTYGRFSVLVYDTSPVMPAEYPEYGSNSVLYHYRGATDKTIGALRNEAIEFAMIAKQPKQFDIFLHADDDDWSHPNRISEQVALLHETGAEAVGYHEMLFWRTRHAQEIPDGSSGETGEAWLYSKRHGLPHALGTSLCYHRSVWEKKPFKDLPNTAKGTGEDYEFIKGLNLVSVSSIAEDGEPRMVASIHSGNTSTGYDLEYLVSRGSQEWKRRPDWDEQLRHMMAL